jgi:hypothetical protein
MVKVRLSQAQLSRKRLLIDTLQFRRSNKSDVGKHDSVKVNFASIPQKDAIAIVPPKKVSTEYHMKPAGRLLIILACR